MSNLNPAVLPDDVSRELALLMDKKYATWRRERFFQISAERHQETVEVTVLFRNSDETFYYPVEARMDFEDEEMKAEEAALFLVNFIDQYFEEYFEEDENLFIPIDWANFEYDAVEFQVKGQVLNKHAEKMADQILASSDPQIIQQ